VLKPAAAMWEAEKHEKPPKGLPAGSDASHLWVLARLASSIGGRYDKRNPCSRPGLDSPSGK